MVTMLADSNNFGDILGDGVAGPLGLLIIVLLVIATVLLVINMNKRLRRLPDHFPDPLPGSRRGRNDASATPVDRTADGENNHQGEFSGN